MRPVIPWPDKRLRTEAEPVTEITKDTHALWDEMIRIMDAMPGYGLAATQIGEMQRLAVLDCSKERGQAIRLANPKVIASSTETFTWEEASPNLPGRSAKVTRPAHVTVAFIDQNGKEKEQDFNDLWATSVQHQIDHLNGTMYFERLSRTKRDMFVKKLGKPK